MDLDLKGTGASVGKSAPGLQDEHWCQDQLLHTAQTPFGRADWGQEVILEPAFVGSGSHLPQLGQEEWNSEGLGPGGGGHWAPCFWVKQLLAGLEVELC